MELFPPSPNQELPPPYWRTIDEDTYEKVSPTPSRFIAFPDRLERVNIHMHTCLQIYSPKEMAALVSLMKLDNPDNISVNNAQLQD